MILAFINTLFLTFLVTRLCAHLLHDQKNYGTKKDSSKTLTHYIRKTTKKDIHHIHIGILLILIIIPLLIVHGITTKNILSLAVALSLIIDQIVPFINRKSDYFDKSNILIALLLHIVVALIAIGIVQN